MRKLLNLSLVLAGGMVLGRMLGGIPLAAGAGGGGGEPCTALNGDVNADGRIDLTDAITILGHLYVGDPRKLPALCAAPGLMGLPDSGQDECSYRNDIFTEWIWYTAPCKEGDCPGQDPQYATGCPMEGIDGSGRFLDNGDGTVNDTCTGLMWQKATADVDGDGESTMADRIDWCEALDYCESSSLAGHPDWRLPNVRELQSLVNYGHIDPAIDEEVFGTFPSWYWSSTSTADDPARAWYVNFLDGFVFRDGKSFSLHVRAVRGGL